jgi:hypothetical protein
MPQKRKRVRPLKQSIKIKGRKNQAQQQNVNVKVINRPPSAPPNFMGGFGGGGQTISYQQPLATPPGIISDNDMMKKLLGALNISNKEPPNMLEAFVKKVAPQNPDELGLLRSSSSAFVPVTSSPSSYSLSSGQSSPLDMDLSPNASPPGSPERGFLFRGLEDELSDRLNNVSSSASSSKSLSMSRTSSSSSLPGFNRPVSLSIPTITLGGLRPIVMQQQAVQRIRDARARASSAPLPGAPTPPAPTPPPRAKIQLPEEFVQRIRDLSARKKLKTIAEEKSEAK